ncbi:MAG: P-II family nitrogen regulator [Haloferula sp.]
MTAIKVPLSLLTIVTEGLLKEQMIELLKNHGATGYTITRADGEGSRGVRARDWEGPNLKFECVLSDEAADAALEELGERYFENYSVIAWVTQVGVLRGDKFAGSGC